MKRTFKTICQSASQTNKLSVLAAVVLFQLAQPAAAGSVKPKLAAVADGVIMYKSPSENVSQLNWNWIDRQSNSQCKKGGFGRRTDKAYLVGSADGVTNVFYLCEKHSAEIAAKLRNLKAKK